MPILIFSSVSEVGGGETDCSAVWVSEDRFVSSLGGEVDAELFEAGSVSRGRSSVM